VCFIWPTFTQTQWKVDTAPRQTGRRGGAPRQRSAADWDCKHCCRDWNWCRIISDKINDWENASVKQNKKHFHQAGSVSARMLMVGGWCVCGVREGSTALQFSFISDILGIVVLVQMLNVFCFTNSGCISWRFICNISDTSQCQMWPVVKVLSWSSGRGFFVWYKLSLSPISPYE